MEDPLASPIPAPKPSDIVGSVEAAAVSIARLDARLSGSFLRSAWARRAAWTGYARALQLQGNEIDEIDVFAWACDLQVPGRAARPTHSDEFAGFAPWLAVMADPAPYGWRDRLPFTPELTPGGARLLDAVTLCHRHARRDGSLQPWLALPDILRGLGLSHSPLPCLVAGARAFRLRATLSDDIVRAALRSLSAAADAGLDRLDAMERLHNLWIDAVREEYRSTSLVRLLALISARPLLSPQSVATELGLTVGGAGKLLARAAERSLLIEISGRRAWRLYLPPDLAYDFGFAQRPRGRPPSLQTPPVRDRTLAEALSAFDREFAEISARLDGLTIGSTGEA